MVTTQRAKPSSKANALAKAGAAPGKVLLRSVVGEMLLVNFEIDPKLIESHLPPGIRVSLFEGDAYISVVAFQQSRLKFRGIPLPISRFPTLGLRVYVERSVGDQVNKGVYYLRQFIPRAGLSVVLGWIFNSSPKVMKIKCENTGFHEADSAIMPMAQYTWSVNEHPNRIKVTGHSIIKKSTEDEKLRFITDQQYTFYQQSRIGVVEMRCDHPPWLVWGAASGSFDCDVESLFGKEFVKPLKRRPSTVLMSRGSEVVMQVPVPIKTSPKKSANR